MWRGRARPPRPPWGPRAAPRGRRERAPGRETVDGRQFDRGSLSPYFATDAEKMEAVLEDGYVLIHDKKISAMKDILPVLEKGAQTGKPLLPIAADIEGEALATLVVNK